MNIRKSPQAGTSGQPSLEELALINRRGPGQPQQKGRDAGPGNELLQNLPHGGLAVQDLVIRADYFNVHISHGDEIPHSALPAGLHSGAPLLGNLLAALGPSGKQYPLWTPPC